MAHPLYHHATRLVGQQVYVHHISGTLHHGTLVSVNPQGLYLMQHPPGARFISADSRDPVASHANDTAHKPTLDAELVYGPAAFFTFGALTGLTAAALLSPWWW